jgi:hypothetical protein
MICHVKTTTTSILNTHFFHHIRRQRCSYSHCIHICKYNFNEVNFKRIRLIILHSNGTWIFFFFVMCTVNTIYVNWD